MNGQHDHQQPTVKSQVSSPRPAPLAATAPKTPSAFG
jgi:hypothetical protein